MDKNFGHNVSSIAHVAINATTKSGPSKNALGKFKNRKSRNTKRKNLKNRKEKLKKLKNVGLKGQLALIIQRADNDDQDSLINVEREDYSDEIFEEEESNQDLEYDYDNEIRKRSLRNKEQNKKNQF